MHRALTALFIGLIFGLADVSFAQDDEPKSPSSPSNSKKADKQPEKAPSKEAPKSDQSDQSFDFEKFQQQAEEDLMLKRGCSYQPPPEPIS